MARRRAPRALAYSDGILRPPRLTFVVVGSRRVAGSGWVLEAIGLGNPFPGMVTDSDGKTGTASGQADWKKAVESTGLDRDRPDRSQALRVRRDGPFPSPFPRARRVRV